MKASLHFAIIAIALMASSCRTQPPLHELSEYMVITHPRYSMSSDSMNATFVDKSNNMFYYEAKIDTTSGKKRFYLVNTDGMEID